MCDVSQEPPKLANGPITRNMAKKFQARLNSWAQGEVSRRIQDQSSMLMEDELKESTKFIIILEVIMEEWGEWTKLEIDPSGARQKRIWALFWWDGPIFEAAMYGTFLGLIFDVFCLVRA